MTKTECIIYKNNINHNGYSRIGNKLAHRLAINAPKDKQVHHKCHNKLCINPDHLELLTPSEHSKLTQRETPHYLLPKTLTLKCKRGHWFTVENTFVREDNGRRCRICTRKNSLEAYHRSKA